MTFLVKKQQKNCHVFLPAFLQRWKNVPVCQQCVCKFFSSSGKMCAKFYAVLLQKWVMSRFCAFLDNTYGFLFGKFLNIAVKRGFFILLLHSCCFYRCVTVLFCSYLLSNTFYAVLSHILFCRKLWIFSGKIVFAQTLLG